MVTRDGLTSGSPSGSRGDLPWRAQHLAPLDVARARALRHARTGYSALDSALTPNRGEKHVFGRDACEPASRNS